ncbi:MAG: hypothetical protein KJ718_00655 [Nanoarchaeota archaeon]|nr:hypothetical protein [Nanoarchaeota archaeon]
MIFFIKETVSELKQSFPLIKSKKIQIKFFSSDKYSGGAFWFLPFWRVLFVNRDRKFNKKEWVGLIAHELAHFEIDQRRGWAKTFFVGILYWIFPDVRKKEEVQTDKMAIKKGYAREVYALAKKLKNKKIRKHYLKPEEIKSYAKKVGKW